jgi:hypothetical protein
VGDGEERVDVIRCIAMAVMLTGMAQTRVSESQIRFDVRVVERFVCTQPAAAAAADCSGIALYRFQMADGSITGPFYAIAAPEGWVMDGRWVRQ